MLRWTLRLRIFDVYVNADVVDVNVDVMGVNVDVVDVMIVLMVAVARTTMMVAVASSK